MALSRINNPFLSSSGSNNTSITSPAANTLAFTTSTTERMRLDSSGQVGIGTASPAADFELKRTTNNTKLQVTSSYEAGIWLVNGGGAEVSVLNAGGSNILQLRTNNQERLKIDSAGLVTIASGQIKFPATQNASADANTLDDYEEGTWTPVLTTSAGTTPTGVTYDTYRYGRYTKIGRVVHIRATVVITSKGTGGAGDVIITGAPFTPANYTGYAYSALSGFYYPAGGITGTLIPVLYDQSTNIYLSTSNAGLVIQWSTISGTEKISINGTYMTD